MRRVALLVIAFAVPVLGAALQALQAPQASQAAQRRGIVIGQVVDGGSGAAVPEAIVTLTPLATGTVPASQPLRVMADPEGRFAFSDLPPGSFQITVAKPGYLPSEYGRRRPNGPGATLDLVAGQRRTDVTILFWRPGVATGTITDEAGEPLVGVEVRTFSRSFVSGAETVVPARFGSSVKTDDRGVFRISELLPGEYIFLVPARATTFPAALVAQAALTGVPFQFEMYSATPELTPLGNPRNQKIGEFVLMMEGARPIPPGPADDGTVGVYRTTFYPSALSLADAVPIAIGSGEERQAVNIQIRPVPAVRVSGTLVVPAGLTQAPRALRLVSGNDPDVMSYRGFEIATAMSDASGAFTLLGVPPGQYTIKVLSPPPSRGPAPPPSADQPLLWANQLLMVGETDISGIRVPLEPAVLISGRSEFRGARPAPSPEILSKALVTLESATPGVATLDGWIQLQATGAFVSSAPGGRYFIRPSPVGGFFAAAVTLQGRDVMDSPFDLKSDVSGVVITYADETQRITGTVRDAQGASDAHAVVLLFPANRGAWTGSGQSPRRFRLARVNSGLFSLVDVAPGDYLLVAVDDAASDQWTDPKRLEALSRVATSVRVRPLSHESVDLKTSVIR